MIVIVRYGWCQRCRRDQGADGWCRHCGARYLAGGGSDGRRRASGLDGSHTRALAEEEDPTGDTRANALSESWHRLDRGFGMLVGLGLDVDRYSEEDGDDYLFPSGGWA